MKNETIYQIEKKRKNEADDVKKPWCKIINSNIRYQFYRFNI